MKTKERIGNMKSNWIITIVGMLFCSVLFAQSKPTEWTVLKENNGVTFEYKYTNCDPKMGFDTESILLKITSDTEGDKEVIFTQDVWYDGVCFSCKNVDEYTYSATVSTNKPTIGTCDDFYSSYKIFSKFTDAQYKGKIQTLTQFNVKNVVVKSLEVDKE